MICKECGAKLNESTRFCTQCGARIQRTEIREDTIAGEPLLENTVSSGPKIVGSIKEPIKNGATHNNREPKRKGCLWTVIKWFLILSILSVILSECSSENSTDYDDNISPETQEALLDSVAETSNETNSIDSYEDIYNWLWSSTEDSIKVLIGSEPIDTDALWKEYQFLTALKIHESMFKATVCDIYGIDGNYFADKRVEYELDLIAQEMYKYFPKESVETYISAMVLGDFYAFDPHYVNYESIWVGSEDDPDLDAMWINYLHYIAANSKISAEESPEEYRKAIQAMLIPTMDFLPQTSEETVPANNYANTEETVFARETTPPTEESTSNVLTGTVLRSAGELNVRSGPGTNYGAIGRLYGGETVTIYEQQDVNGTVWGNIGYGWVSMDYIVFGIDNSIAPSTGTSNDLRSEYYGLWVSDDRQWCMTITPNGNGVDITVEQYYSPNGVSRWAMTGEFEENSFIKYWDGTLTDYVDGSVAYSYGGCEGAIGLYGNAVEWTQFFDDLGTSTSMMLTRTDHYSNPYS